MQDIQQEIRDIQQEILESRALIIRTNHLVSALHADVQRIRKQQVVYERRFHWNGGLFLVTVTVVLFVCLKIASDAKIQEISRETNELRTQVSLLRDQVQTEQANKKQRKVAQTKALNLYQMFRDHRYQDLVQHYPTIEHLTLSKTERAFFQDAYEQAKEHLALQAYQHGLHYESKQRYKQALASFQRSIQLHPSSPYRSRVQFHLALALYHTNQPTQAIPFLQQVLQQQDFFRLHDDAAFLLSQCAKKNGDTYTEQTVLQTLIRQSKRSPFVPKAKQRLRQLRRQ